MILIFFYNLKYTCRVGPLNVIESLNEYIFHATQQYYSMAIVIKMKYKKIPHTNKD